MDNKRIVTLVFISIAVMAAWIGLNRLIQMRHPEWYASPQPEPATQPSATSATTTAPGVGVAAAASRPAPSSARSMSATTGPAPSGEAGELRVATAEGKRASLGHSGFDKDGKSDWPLGVVIEPAGAGLASVTLNRYRDVVGKDDPYVFQRPDEKGAEYEQVALAARSISIDDGPWLDISNASWWLDKATTDSASYSIDIVADTAKALTVTKTYQLRKKTDPGEGFELNLTYSFTNHTSKAQKVKLSLNGPNVPPVENLRDIPEIIVGYNDEGKYVGFDHFTGSAIKKDVPTSLAVPKRAIMWAGITSAYFDCIVLGPKLDQFADVQVHSADTADADSGQEYLVMKFITNEISVPPAADSTTAPAAADFPLEIYFGPRQRELLGSSHYSAYPRGYQETIVIKSKGFPGSICAACTWGWLIDGLVWMLNKFHLVLRDWGLSIILLVLIVRLMLHPITKRSQISMQKMTKMGPEVEKLKKKFGDDKDGLNRAMMDLYKQQGFTPIFGCLPMFLQMPIWIALWSALQGTFELRHSSFLWGFTWIKDLAQPDRMIPFHRTFHFLMTFDALNLLPLLMGVVMWLQQKMTPTPAAETPEQAQQRKMMMWMSLLFPFFLYNGPAGLNLYILASTAIGIWESKRVRDHIKAQEAAETEGKVIIDAAPTRASKRLARDDQRQQPQPGCLAGWLAELQKKTEAMRDDTQKKRPKK